MVLIGKILHLFTYYLHERYQADTSRDISLLLKVFDKHASSLDLNNDFKVTSN